MRRRPSRRCRCRPGHRRSQRVSAPNSLGSLPGLINNVLTAPAPNTGLLQALGQNFANQKDFDTALTGAQQLASILNNTQDSAAAARKDAMAQSQAITQAAMSTLGGIVTGQGGAKNGQDSSGKGGGGSSGGSSGSSGASDAISAIAPIVLAALL